MMACMGHFEIVERLLEEKKCNVNRQNDHGDTALLKAISSRQFDIVKALITFGGVDIRVKNNNGLNALEKARKMITETDTHDVTDEERKAQSNIELLLRRWYEKEELKARTAPARNSLLMRLFSRTVQF